MFLISYPIFKLSYKTEMLTLNIQSPDTSEREYSAEKWGDFEISLGDLPHASAPLVFVPEPDIGLSNIQAQEQTPYNVWLEWDGSETPQIFLGEDSSPLGVKRYGTQAYALLNWGNYVGASTLRVYLGEREVITLPVEVRSRKMGYLDDYRVMLDDISERLTALVFDFGSPTSVYAQRHAQDTHIAYLDYLFLRYLMDDTRLPLAFRLVVADPHRATVRKSVWNDVSQARAMTAHSVYAMMAHPEHLTRPCRSVAPAVQARLDGYLPHQILDERVITSFDTPPNRFVKHFLEQLIFKLRELEACFAAEIHSVSLSQDCARWRRDLEHMACAHFLEDVGAMHLYPAGSQVLLTGKVTREGFENLLKTPNKDLATLYEYWGFFQLLDAVSAAIGVSINPRDFVIEEGDIFRVTLNQNGRSKGRIGAATVYYNRYFYRRSGESYSVTLHPDYVVELPDRRRFVFDAKYKYDHTGQFMSEGDDPEEEHDEDEHLIYKKGDLYQQFPEVN